MKRLYTVLARRDYIFIIALPWGHVNVPVEFVPLNARIGIDRTRCLLLPSSVHVPHVWDIYNHSVGRLYREVAVGGALTSQTLRAAMLEDNRPSW